MTEYYGNNDYRDYLIHFGVPGMKWGKHLKKKFYEVKDAAANKLNDVRSEIEYQAEQVTDKITGERSKRNSKTWKDKANRHYNYASEARREGANKTAYDNARSAEAAKEQSQLWRESYNKSLGGRIDNAVKKRNAKKNNRESNIRGMRETQIRKAHAGDTDGAVKAFNDWGESRKYIKPISKKRAEKLGNPRSTHELTMRGGWQAGKEIAETALHNTKKKRIEDQRSREEFKRRYDETNQRIEDTQKKVEEGQREFDKEWKKRKRRG